MVQLITHPFISLLAPRCTFFILWPHFLFVAVSEAVRDVTSKDIQKIGGKLLKIPDKTCADSPIENVHGLMLKSHHKDNCYEPLENALEEIQKRLQKIEEELEALTSTSKVILFCIKCQSEIISSQIPQDFSDLYVSFHMFYLMKQALGRGTGSCVLRIYIKTDSR